MTLNKINFIRKFSAIVIGCILKECQYFCPPLGLQAQRSPRDLFRIDEERESPALTIDVKRCGSVSYRMNTSETSAFPKKKCGKYSYGYLQW